MKICEQHWADLRAAIHAKGMSHLVASNAEEVASRLRAELEGTADGKTFDPLMAANNAIWAAALERGGLYLIGPRDDGSEYCPLCEARDRGGQDPAQWIDGCTDAMRAHCVKLGLLTEGN